MNKVFIEFMDRFLLSVIGGVKLPMALIALSRIGLAKNNGVAGVPGCKLPVTGCQKLMAIGIGVKMVRVRIAKQAVLSARVISSPP
jgi:hypothetical protein